MKTYLLATMHSVVFAAAVWFLTLMLSVMSMQLTHGQIYLDGDNLILIGFGLTAVFIGLNIHRVANNKAIIRFPV